MGRTLLALYEIIKYLTVHTLIYLRHLESKVDECGKERYIIYCTVPLYFNRNEKMDYLMYN